MPSSSTGAAKTAWGVWDMQQAVRHAEQPHRRREDGRDDQAAAVALPRRAGGRRLLRHAVSQLLDGKREIAYPRDGGVELHGGRIGGQIHIGAAHARSIGERVLDGARAGGAGHSGYRQVNAFRGRGLHAGTSKPSCRTASARVSGFTISASYSTVAQALTRSTVALVTPGVAESFRSTLREQLPQVIPPTFIFMVCADIPI